MGIIGLQAFLRNNMEMFERTKLSDTDLVIDASALYRKLYDILMNLSGSAKEEVIGGDMVAYGKLVRLFFEKLRLCNIRPILVNTGAIVCKRANQDGSLLSREEKIIWSLDRFQSLRRIRNRPLYHRSPAGITVWPQTIQSVLKSIVVELGIRQVQCPYSPQASIAELANDLDCPVLTYNPSILVHDIRKGFIPIDKFDFFLSDKQAVSSNHKTDATSMATQIDGPNSITRPSIECLILTQGKFLGYFNGLQPSTLPLVAIFLGISHHRVYNHVMMCDRATRGTEYQGPLRVKNSVHQRLVKMLTWLRGKSPTQAIDLFPCSPRERARMHFFLDEFKVRDCDNLISELDQIYSPLEEAPETPARYLARLLEQGHLAGDTLDLVFNNGHFNFLMIDDHRLPSSNFVKDRPTSVCLALVRSSSPDQQFGDGFEIWDRIGQIYEKKLIYPLMNLDKFGSLENLNIYTMISMDREAKKSLLFATFHSSQQELEQLVPPFMEIMSNDWAQQAGLLMMLVKYIGTETGIATSRNFLGSLYLTLIYYGHQTGKNPLIPAVFEGDQEAILNYFHGGQPLALVDDTTESLYLRMVHMVRQFQEAIISYDCLNSLLDTPWHCLKLEQYLNCLYILNLIKQLIVDEISLESLLGGPEHMILLECYYSIETLVIP